MKPTFADTSYYIALLSADDAYHEAAVAWSRNRLGQTVVTEYVLVELGSALSHSRDRDRYVPFVEVLLSHPETVYLPASEQLFRQGRRLFAARPDKDWSLVDCISFVVMKQRRLSDALTTDHHFEQAGYRVLLRGPSP